MTSLPLPQSVLDHKYPKQESTADVAAHRSLTRTTRRAAASPQAVESLIQDARFRRATSSAAALGLLETLVVEGLLLEPHRSDAARLIQDYDEATDNLKIALAAMPASSDSVSLYAHSGKSPDQILRALEGRG